MAEINKVVVVGAGTMGAGIAGICAAAGCDVALLDLQRETAQAGIDRLGAGKRPALAEEHFERLQAGSIDDLEQHVADADWICEAIVENLQIKRDFFARVEAARKDGSLVTTNTSGIPLRDILDGMPERLQSDMAVTHFFNPPHIMRLLEFVPSEQAGPALTARIAEFCGGRLGKGAVYAPNKVYVFVSDEPNFDNVVRLSESIDFVPFRAERGVYKTKVNLGGVKGRYIRLDFYNNQNWTFLGGVRFLPSDK